MDPQAAESSAYHTCLQMPSSFLMRGMDARPYIAMAKGSPWVVPSCDRMTSPSTKNSVLVLYELIRMVAIDVWCYVGLPGDWCNWKHMWHPLVVRPPHCPRRSRCVDSGLYPRHLATTQLETTSCILNVWGSDEHDMIRRAVSPMPMGRVLVECNETAYKKRGNGTYEEHSLCVTDARAAQRSREAPLWLVHRRLHSWASNPEGPAAPFTRSAAERMALASMESKMMGWGSCGDSGRTHFWWTGWAGGCLLISMSLTDGDDRSSGFDGSLRWSRPLVRDSICFHYKWSRNRFSLRTRFITIIATSMKLVAITNIVAS